MLRVLFSQRCVTGLDIWVKAEKMRLEEMTHLLK